MKTLLLSSDLWDLVTDAAGNIALASEPYSLAQDAASACRLFLGELYYSTTEGVPYWSEILGHQPPLALLKARLITAAMRVPGVIEAQVYISSVAGRIVRGQVQVTDTAGNITAAGF